MLWSCTTIEYKAPEISPSLFEECPQAKIEVDKAVTKACDENDIKSCKKIIIGLINHSFKQNKTISTCNAQKQEIRRILKELGE